MKNKLVITCFLISTILPAQQNIDDLLAAGINDAQRFATDYLQPASDGLMYSMNNGWFNDAKTKKLFGFEISLVANAAFVDNTNKSFILDTSQYENLQFRDGTTRKEVATAFGDIQDIVVIVEGESTIPGLPAQDAEFTLPTGLGTSNISFVPTAFLQASFGFLKGTEIKARFFPKLKTNDAEVGFYGIGLQHDFTSWLPAEKVFPAAISALIAYTHLNGSYDFTNTNIVEGENQSFVNNTDTFLFQVIGSTTLPVFNVYGGIGYLSGTSTTDLKGTYRVQSGIISQEEITDPFSIESNVSGVRGTLGAKVKLAFFRFNIDYTLAEYNSISLALNFGI